MAKNTLGSATSPYLRQHADNPVHWQQWTPEALAEAVAGSSAVLVTSPPEASGCPGLKALLPAITASRSWSLVSASFAALKRCTAATSAAMRCASSRFAASQPVSNSN